MNEGEWFTAAEAAQETGKHRTTVRHDLNKLYYAGVRTARLVCIVSALNLTQWTPTMQTSY